MFDNVSIEEKFAVSLGKAHIGYDYTIFFYPKNVFSH